MTIRDIMPEYWLARVGSPVNAKAEALELIDTMIEVAESVMVVE